MVPKQQTALTVALFVVTLMWIGTMLLMTWVQERQTQVFRESRIELTKLIEELRGEVSAAGEAASTAAAIAATAAANASRVAVSAAKTSASVTKGISEIKRKVAQPPIIIKVPVPAPIEPQEPPRKRGLFGK